MQKYPTLKSVAFKPKWIIALILALAISTIFVLLSQWQFDRSTQEAPSIEERTKNKLDKPQKITDVLQPSRQVSSDDADQIVTLEGAFHKDQQVLVENRLQDGENGYWLVTYFETAGKVTLPVIRAWVKSTDSIFPAPDGKVSVKGRLLPTEAPEPNKKEDRSITYDGDIIDIVELLSTAQLLNKWVPYNGNKKSYIAAVASDQVLSAKTDLDNSEQIKPISLVPQQETPFNWLNIFYAIEWIVFAGFALFIWWRLVRDDYQRDIEEYEESLEKKT